MNAFTRSDPAAIVSYVQRNAARWLRRSQVGAICVAEREVGGRGTGELCVRFCVMQKLGSVELSARRLKPLPPSIEIAGRLVPTDIVERRYRLLEGVVDRIGHLTDPLRPGLSISNRVFHTGTLGAIVRHVQTGRVGLLSNAHVFDAGSPLRRDITQPGLSDGGGGRRFVCAEFERSALAHGLDAAFARLRPGSRRYDPTVLGLDLIPRTCIAPAKGMRVVKSGRRTGVTHGVISAIGQHVAMDFNGVRRSVQAFEMESAAGASDELSAAGDSGSLVLRVDPTTGQATSEVVGLLFGGDLLGSAREFALACPMAAILQRLDLEFVSTPGGVSP